MLFIFSFSISSKKSNIVNETCCYLFFHSQFYVKNCFYFLSSFFIIILLSSRVEIKLSKFLKEKLIFFILDKKKSIITNLSTIHCFSQVKYDFYFDYVALLIFLLLLLIISHIMQKRQLEFFFVNVKHIIGYITDSRIYIKYFMFYESCPACLQ